MLFDLDDAIFRERNSRDLIHLFSGRRCHRLRIGAPGSQFESWLQGSDIPREMVNARLVEDAELEASSPAGIRLKVLPIEVDDLNQSPPVVSLETAMKLYREPLKLFVENGKNDGDFLRAIVPALYRSAFNEYLRSWEIELRHGGGGTTAAQVQQEVDAGGWRRRILVVLDSDAWSPGMIPTQTRDHARKCGRPTIILERRFAESYLPLPALRRWFERLSETHRSGKSLPSDFEQLPRECRWYFNMRLGREGDSKSLGRSPEEVAARDQLWQGVDFSNLTSLQHGFKRQVREAFAEIESGDFDDDPTVHQEALNLFRQILELV